MQARKIVRKAVNNLGEDGTVVRGEETAAWVKPEVVEVEESPATPVPVSEAPEDPPWPQAGVRVALGIEHLSHTLRLGETGVCEGPSANDPDEVVVRFDTVKTLAPLNVQTSLLVPVGDRMRNLKFWDKWSEPCKRTVLRNLGVRDPRDEVLPWTPCLNLAMWGEYLPLALRLNEFLPGPFSV